MSSPEFDYVDEPPGRRPHARVAAVLEPDGFTERVQMTRGLLLDSNPVPKHSQALPLAGDDCAMFETWLLSGSGTVTGVTVTVEASGDRENWTDRVVGGTSTLSTTLTAIPSYVASEDAGQFSPAFTHVRLRYDLAGTSTPTAMIDAAIRTYVHD